MTRTTIALPDSLAQLVAREAKRRGTSVSDVVRTALVKHMGLAPDKPRKLPFVALGKSGHRHTARDVEQILSREWDDVRHR
jgi:hypothetical protein